MGALPSSASRGVAWESTIFFAPELRGRGLLPVAFCHQTHLPQILPAGTELVSSIGDWNERSIHAHQVWAEVCGWEAAWEAAWEVVCEEVRGRVAHVLRWPSARPIPHPCHRDA